MSWHDGEEDWASCPDCDLPVKFFGMAKELEGAKAREDAGPRPQVRQFADLMEARLKANDHKAGWRGERLPYLFRRLREETDELFEAMRPSADWRMASEAVGREAADVANFAMMIADICGALAASEPPGTAKREEGT